jgi:hypothetical protein
MSSGDARLNRQERSGEADFLGDAMTLSYMIGEGKVAELRRVEDWLRSHPDSSVKAISAALNIKPSTLHGYIAVLRELGRVRRQKHVSPGLHGSLPDTYTLVDLPPLGTGPLPLAPRPTPAPAHAQRMDYLVACFFGMTKEISS